VSSVSVNLNDLLVVRHIRAGHGDSLAVIDDTGSWTFRELDHAAGAVAGILAAKGVGAGDRVALVLPDSRAWCATFLGATRIGAICAPLEPGGRHLDVTLQDLAAAITVAEPSADLPAGTRSMVVDVDELAGLPALPVGDVAPTTPAYMIFSSGSTGRPKGVVHAHKDLAASIDGYSVEVLGLVPADRCHSVAKLFASLGFGNGFFRPLGRGATIVLFAGRPTVRSVMRVVADHKVSVLTGVPTFWSQLATFLERHDQPRPLADVRVAVSSGDSLPATVLSRMIERTGVELLEGLGCSECSNIVLSTRPGHPMPGRLGTIVGGVEIALRDEEGREVADGAPGRLWIKSPSNTTGYWARPEETADVVHGEWIRMGDILRRDDGVYRHLGRVDDIFKVDARWVSPIEVEGALYEHPAVTAAAVVAYTDEAGLTRVGAAVTTNQPAGEELAADLRRHVAHRLAPYMAPSLVRFVEDLPRGATGKVNRGAIRAAFGAISSI
jgi:acyl-coenzyme A synthetase/AMP-(fatty) acid ligase